MTDLGNLDYYSLTRPHTITRTTDRWNGSCHSDYQAPLGNVPARYYTFELTEVSHIIIDLELLSSVSGVDPFLALWSGELSSEPQIQMSNDNNQEKNTADARIALELPAGTYTIEATMANAPPAGSVGSRFKLKIEVSELIPYLGHQADYTVQYKIGDMPPTRTPAPSVTPTPTVFGPIPPTSMPTRTPFPDPAAVIPAAIPTAVTAWNTAVAVKPWPDVLFCERKPTTATLPHIAPIPCPTRTHDDGDKVILNVRDGSGSDRSVSPPGSLSSIDDAWEWTKYLRLSHCGSSYACVKPDPVTAFWHLNPIGNGHLGSLQMIIEEPAWYYDKENQTHTRYIWTDVYRTRYPDIGLGQKMVYLPSVLMHEFGHAAGLTDLYAVPNSPQYRNYLMHTKVSTSIPQLDIDYLHQVYRNEHGSEAHRK